MLTSNYQYILENGTYLNYALSPGCDLISVIDKLASAYVSARPSWIPDRVLVRPEVFSELNVQCAQKFAKMYLQNFTPPPGFTQLQLVTVIGPLQIIPIIDLEYPIFIGKHKELRDNCFDSFMEQILQEAKL